MEPCTVKWIIIGISLLITITGLWLSVLREFRSIKRGKKDIQSIIYDKEKGTYNFSLAIGIVLIGGGLFSAIYTEKNNIGCNPVTVSQDLEIEEGKILFKLDYDYSMNNLRLLQRAPKFNERNIVKQESGYFNENIELPSGNDNYFALITPSLDSNILGDNVVQTPLEICFKRTKIEIKEDDVIAIIHAGNDKIFKRASGDPNYVTLCNENQISYWDSFSLFSSAFAQTIPDRTNNYGWAVPNLQTLNDKKETGFSQITIESKLLNKQVKEANLYYYSVKINDTPIYFDGLLPKHILNPFSYEDGLHIKFGLENLGFSGNNDGYEKIEIIVEFFQDSDFIKSIPLTINYVALRSTETDKIVSNDDSIFEWEANFKANNENQIFILSTTDLQEAIRTKNKINSKSLTFNDNKLVGVIRPPYRDNPHYGICVGLVLPNKQIQFTFKYNHARELEEYLKNQNYKPLIRSLKDN